ncbi:hypothetical protein H0176_00770 [Methylorubrum populi]|uniref:Uncharacterized protein n=1 Tax=Methylorubrum rhodesianum TaxID=29427 RepID=A0ABU9Z4I5_9HYPH|nr:hypothetical protein [Methylorubrum rhodesianum]MBK3402637.1 hypothetical protein [Methylorubrum rhodesianum]MBY0138814.1 hypothetical protein [Methylorubrum populi]
MRNTIFALGALALFATLSPVRSASASPGIVAMVSSNPLVAVRMEHGSRHMTRRHGTGSHGMSRGRGHDMRRHGMRHRMHDM